MSIIILPGINGSGETHWQTIWEREDPGMVRFQPSDWDNPDLNDWLDALDRAVRGRHRPPILVAHSLSCLLVAHWGRRTPPRPWIRGAFLVSVPDPESPDFPRAEAPTFCPVPDTPLPFPSLIVASENDPFGSFEYQKRRAAEWETGFVSAGAHGHMNGASGLGDWPLGAMLLEAFRSGGKMRGRSKAACTRSSP